MRTWWSTTPSRPSRRGAERCPIRRAAGNSRATVPSSAARGWPAGGRGVAQALVQFDVPLRIGDAEIGNWNLASRRDSAPIRYLSGCVDELMVFSRALSDREIERLHARGQPPL